MSDTDADLLAAAWWHARQRENTGEAGRAGLSSWQAHSADRRRAYAAVSRTAAAVEASATHPDLQAMVAAAMSRATRPKRPRGARLALFVGAVVAAPLAAFTWRYVRPAAETAPPPRVVTTEVGGQKRVSLPDGGTLLLDSSSRAIIRETDGGTSVVVRGQAYLTSGTGPLVIQAGELDLAAHDGQFNVRNMGGRQDVLAASGTADVTFGNARVRLTSGQAVATGSGRPRIRTIAEPELVLGWRDGWLHFDDAAVPSAVAEMNRYRRHPLMIRGNEASRMRISGSFRIAESDSFARLLAAALPLRSRKLPDGTTEMTSER